MSVSSSSAEATGSIIANSAMNAALYICIHLSNERERSRFVNGLSRCRKAPGRISASAINLYGIIRKARRSQRGCRVLAASRPQPQSRTLHYFYAPSVASQTLKFPILTSLSVVRALAVLARMTSAVFCSGCGEVGVGGLEFGDVSVFRRRASTGSAMRGVGVSELSTADVFVSQKPGPPWSCGSYNYRQSGQDREVWSLGPFASSLAGSG